MPSTCQKCKHQFKDKAALRNHYHFSPAHEYCKKCRKHFTSHSAFVMHYHDERWYCEDHNRFFTSEWQFDKHYIAEHWYCKDHSQLFNSEWQYNKHFVDEHWYCKDHNRFFDSESQLDEHYDSKHEYCSTCRVHLKNRNALFDHAMRHHRICIEHNRIFTSLWDWFNHTSSPEHVYCFSCQHDFHSQQNFQQHLSSRTHRAAQVRCPMKNCDRSFISVAALGHHLESGTCTLGMTRANIGQIIARYDMENTITSPARMTAGVENVATRWLLTDRSWNSQTYECPLCNIEFRSLNSLNKHITNPRHESQVHVRRKV